MAIKNSLALLLNLLLPALLSSLHPLQHCVSSSLTAVCLRTHLLDLRVLLVVQRLGVRVVFADEGINQEQEQHVEQQSTHHRQVDDDGYL